MVKIIDKVLLFIYSLIVGIASILLIVYGGKLVPESTTWFDLDAIVETLGFRISIIVSGAVILLLSIRFVYLSSRGGRGSVPSIDQRTDYGDIRISLETVENLTLKAASRIKGITDIKARVNVTQAGIEVVVRSVVDGETSIPELTEETQRAVKQHVEEITGIPVASVAVYVANVIQSVSFKSRVE